MGDRSSILLGVLAGAVVGGVVGYLYFTEDGRRLRQDIEPRIGELMGEFEKVRTAGSQLMADTSRAASAAVSDVRSFGRPS